MYMCTEMHVGNVFQKTMQSRQLYDLKLHASLLLEVYLCLSSQLCISQVYLKE